MQTEPNQIPSNSPQKGESNEIKPLPTESSGTSAKSFLFTFFGAVGVLIAVFYGLLLWAVLNGTISNPIFETIGFTPVDLKFTLANVTNFLFGLLSLAFLITTLVKFFQWVMSPIDTYNRSHPLKVSGSFFVGLIALISVWVWLYVAIDGAQVEQITKVEDSLIVSVPADTIGLTTPITVKFDIGTELYKEISPQLVRKIDWDLNDNGAYDDPEDGSGSTVEYTFSDKGPNNGEFLVQARVRYFSPITQRVEERVEKRNVTITNEKVEASIQAFPLTGQTPLEVEISAENSRDPDGEIVMYEWDLDDDGDFDDANGREEKVVRTVFNTVGEHTVHLRVRGRNNNESATASVTVVTKPADERIRAEIVSSDSAFSGVAPVEITLDGSQSFTKEGTITKYEWSVEGEDKTVLNRRIKRTFDTPGTYQVTLTVENDKGERDQETKIIQVDSDIKLKILTNPEPDKDDVLRGTAPFAVMFDANESDVPRAVEWRWDFQNDQIIDSFSSQVSHTFRNPGVYEALLTIVDADDNSYEITRSIIVDTPEISAEIFADPIAGNVPLVVNFDGSGSRANGDSIIDYIWEFPGEAPIHYGAKISREFREIGTFPVKLTILTDKEETAEKQMLISVRAQSLQAKFQMSPTGGAVPLTVQFDPTTSTGNIREYRWDFGDGTVSRDVIPQHEFTTPGSYTVRLKINDYQGVVSEETLQITVE